MYISNWCEAVFKNFPFHKRTVFHYQMHPSTYYTLYAKSETQPWAHKKTHQYPSQDAHHESFEKSDQNV